MNFVFSAFSCSLMLHIHLHTSSKHRDMLAPEQANISRLTPAVNLRIIRIQVGMQTMFGDQRRKIGSVQYKQQRSEDGVLRHPELDELAR